MPHRQKAAIKEPRKQAKAPKSEKTSKNLISLKLSDQERRIMERITRATSKDASEIIREAFSFWVAKRQRLCLDI
ncbi:MAG: CopG family transcriptional regulator [Trichlorobacter sp.]|uniref:CopG family transcriptional regulator n=1 Tax=Trichlorobacter sp. TaxID=2911007 RepID=UPI0025683DA7|nr:CopG family transcriptional regulator [Trichlorobacter sp.]MDK9717084.1 CopG family transcriptional regulator [Trichlorobacter sp.]